MIKFKEDGLIDRWITFYGFCPEEDKSNFCAIWWRALVGLLVIGIICMTPTAMVLVDLHIYYTKVVGVDSLLFNWVPDQIGTGDIGWVLLIVIWTLLIIASVLLQVFSLVSLALYLLYHILYVYNKIAFVGIIKYSVKSYFEPLGKITKPMSKVVKPLVKSVSTGISNVKEVYRSIKYKYCPTVVWVKEEDK